MQAGPQEKRQPVWIIANTPGALGDRNLADEFDRPYLSRTAEFLQARIIQPGNHAPFVENFIMAGMLEPKRDGCHRPSQQPLPRAATSQGGLFLGIKAYEYYAKFDHDILPGHIGEVLPGAMEPP